MASLKRRVVKKKPKDKKSKCAFFIRTTAIFLVIVLAIVSYTFTKGPHQIQKSYYEIHFIEEIQDSCDRHVVNPYLVCAVIKAESEWSVGAQSDAGAIGLMQVLPETAQYMVDIGAVDGKAYPVDQLAKPRVNIEYGTAYLRYLVNRYHEIETVIAAYNAGPGTVNSWKTNDDQDIRDVIAYPETEKYLLKVVRNKEIYEDVYPHVFEPVTRK